MCFELTGGVYLYLSLYAGVSICTPITILPLLYSLAH